jgi:hypothetical protein
VPLAPSVSVSNDCGSSLMTAALYRNIILEYGSNYTIYFGVGSGNIQRYSNRCEWMYQSSGKWHGCAEDNSGSASYQCEWTNCILCGWKRGAHFE